jgi:excisionase family DNA binding protein
MTNLSDYMHSAEAAEYLGIHHNTIRKWAASAELPVHRHRANGYRLLKRGDLDQFLQTAAKPVKQN